MPSSVTRAVNSEIENIIASLSLTIPTGAPFLSMIVGSINSSVIFV
jgi:hypothetical protein